MSDLSTCYVAFFTKSFNYAHIMFSFQHINIASATLTGRVMWMLVSRNFARQGKASAKPDGVVTYVEGFESSDNEAVGGLLDKNKILSADAIKTLLISRNCRRRGVRARAR